jgi:hypothetical protein
MPKTIDFHASGSMDARSSADELQLSEFRYKKNLRLITKNKVRRASGFDKLMTREGFNNEDLHDQLLSLTDFDARLPVTFLFQATSTRKSTKLLAGTSKALYAQNVSTGNWKIISDIYGTDVTRWRAAQVQDTVIFSNNYDALVAWQFDQGITEDDNQSVAEIPDLRDTIELTKAGVVVAWKGHIFLMNVVVSGAVYSNAIYWCDFNNPTSWLPSDASTAGNAEVDNGETILAAKVLQNRLLIFTNRGIHELQAVGGERVFALATRYYSQEGDSCLFYPNTLVSKGDELVYAGADGIYVFSQFMDKPKRVDWIHKASSVMFDSINRSDCETHVAGYDVENKELLFSYATGDNSLPNETLVLHTEHPHAHVVDHGFSAMTMFVLKDNILIMRDFLLNNCICDNEGLDEYWDQFEKEGQFCDGSEPEEPVCDDPPTSLFTTDTRTTSFDGDEVITEDWAVEEASEDSLCEQLGSVTLNSLCELEARADECNSGQRFVVASSTDYCLKEFSDNFYREMFLDLEEDDPDYDECGNYERLGYQSVLRSGPINGGVTDQEKRWSRFEIEAAHVDQATPSQFEVRIGNHSQAVDPNNDNCGILWDEQDAKDIDCLSGDTAEGHASAGTRPSETYDWPLYYKGNYLYFELTIANPDLDPEDTGGDVTISRMSIEMEVIKTRR